MEDRISQEISKLLEVADKYRELNKKTNFRYQWRIQAIYNQIEVLQAVRSNTSMVPDWEKCYEEDSREI